MSGAGVTLQLSGARSQTFSGVTDNSGATGFRVHKAPSGNYTATVTSLTSNGYQVGHLKGHHYCQLYPAVGARRR